ncbi:MAG: hypothetical protein Q9201_001573 [Fulgogasparrea decipioides]
MKMEAQVGTQGHPDLKGLVMCSDNNDHNVRQDLVSEEHVDGSDDASEVEEATAVSFPLLKLPYDIRRRIYEQLYPTQQTLYITMGAQAVREPAPVDYHLPQGSINLMRCCKLVKGEIYEILYGTNRFALNPQLPDLQMPSEDKPHISFSGQVGAYITHISKNPKSRKHWDLMEMRHFSHFRTVFEYPYPFTWFSINCFLKHMTAATCSMVRELQIFLGHPESQLFPRPIRMRTIRLFPRVIVTSIPLFYGGAIYHGFGYVGHFWIEHMMVNARVQARQRRKLAKTRMRIAFARAGDPSITVWDNLKESSCGGLFLMEGTEGFRYEHLAENEKWWGEYKEYLRDAPEKARKAMVEQIRGNRATGNKAKVIQKT